MSFAHPVLALLGLLALAILALLVHRGHAARAIALASGSPGGARFASPARTRILLAFVAAMELVGLAALVLAAAGPRLLHRETVWLERGADILFVLDVSPSMSARDMDGRSRFDVARDLMRGFARARPADSIGLIGVGQSAALLVPATPDRNTLYARIDSLAIAELGDGTALGMGLAIAALHLKSSSATRKLAVLISDGENNAGEIHPSTAASALRETGTDLWVIGLGSMGEVVVDYLDPASGQRRTGLFDSRFDAEALRELAAVAGGTYSSAPTLRAFDAAFARLDEAERRVGLSRQTVRPEPLQRPFILVGLALLAVARFVRRILLGAFA